MAYTPFEWNIVVAGAWNLAILTPQGIAKRLFGLEPATPVEVLIAIDRPSTIKVIHQGVSVEPNFARLAISPTVPLTRDSLVAAGEIACNALRGLPETPVTGAGVNIQFRSDDVPTNMSDAIASTADVNLSNAGFQIASRSIGRALSWEDGVINLVIKDDQETGIVSFNFHRDSETPADLISWIEKVARMVEVSQTILTAVLPET